MTGNEVSSMSSSRSPNHVAVQRVRRSKSVMQELPKAILNPSSGPHQLLDSKMLIQTLSYVFPRESLVIVEMLQYRVSDGFETFTASRALKLLRSFLVKHTSQEVDSNVINQLDRCLGNLGASEDEMDSLTDAQRADCRLHIILFLSNVLLYERSHHQNVLNYLNLWFEILRPLFRDRLCSECVGQQGNSHVGECPECGPDAILALSIWLYVLLFRSACCLSQWILDFPIESVTTSDIAVLLSQVVFLCALTKGERAFWRLTESVTTRSIQYKRQKKSADLGKWLRIYVDAAHVFSLLKPRNNAVKASILTLFTHSIGNNPDSTRVFLVNFPALAERVRNLETVSHRFLSMQPSWHKLREAVGGVLGVYKDRQANEAIISRIEAIKTFEKDVIKEDLTAIKATSNIIEDIEVAVSRILERPIVLQSPQRSHTTPTDRLVRKLNHQSGEPGNGSGSLLDVFMALHGSRKEFFTKFSSSIAGHLVKHIWKRYSSGDTRGIEPFVRDCIKLFKLIRERLTQVDDEDSYREAFVFCEQLLKDCHFSLRWQKKLDDEKPDKTREIYVLTRQAWPRKIDFANSPEASTESVATSKDDSIVSPRTDDSLSSNSFPIADLVLNSCLNKFDTPVSTFTNEIAREFSVAQPNRTLHYLGAESWVELEVSDKKKGNRKKISVTLLEGQILAIIATTPRDGSAPLTHHWLTKQCGFEGDVLTESIRSLMQKGFVKKVGKGPLEDRELALAIFDEQQAPTENEGHQHSDKKARLETAILAALGRLEKKIHCREIAAYDLFPEVKKSYPDLRWHDFNSVLNAHVETGLVINQGGYFRLAEQQNYN
eukprot:Blabericola_migrator_1__10934@NODE_631_length_7153_cov_120_080581_g462_i0_p2_GENE_NODE_631_length_7153_cov_120_080581_g462_i0NODE_631_length_7153_cov_120_080581_g462_i0_p2_ORF_typecomplete_len831_score108_33DUF2285/PF10074_9/0_32Ribosomal_S27/PF01599_19/15Ribosomal_S27/PF01599_19/1_3e02_NODE_631_length_7153_cov_120_080581_g462_i06733165